MGISRILVTLLAMLVLLAALAFEIDRQSRSASHVEQGSAMANHSR